MIEDVVIVGAGPTGLMLACELRLAGCRPLVIERLPAPTGLSKALTISGRAIDLLAHRGLLARFRAAESPHTGSMARLFHFGGIPINLEDLAGEAPKFVFVLQATTERLLAERASELGVEVRRGYEVTGLAQTEDGVHLTVHTTTGVQSLDARFVVGCDGAQSVVRELAGIAFTGTPPTRLLRLGDVKLAADVGDHGGWRDGRAPFVPLGDGYVRVIATEPYPADFDRSTAMTLEELTESVRRSTGKDVRFSEARWLSRFTDASRQADRYRAGRVFVAGDAAHVQLPAGGPGLSTGLNDAVNLGWKLAAELHHRAPPGLLDSYHAERHPAAARVLMHTRAQGLILTAGEHSRAMREVFTELMADEPVRRRLVDMLQGYDVHYAMGSESDPHPLVGRFVPDLSLVDGRGELHVADLMHDARGLLLDLGDDPALREQARGWSERVDVVTATCPSGGSANALLIRPDGYVAWAGASPLGLERTLQRWFGTPS